MKPYAIAKDPNRKYAYIDFEYNGTAECILNLVSCALLIHKDDKEISRDDFWLHKDDHAKTNLKFALKAMRHNTIFVSYNVVAEAQSFIALGLDPVKFAWVDLALEWKMLTNHNDEWGYGEQLIDGKIKTTQRKNKWEMSDEELKNIKSDTRPANLVGACFKLTGNILDAAHKDEMRDLIISKPASFSNEDRRRILEYGRGDVVFLPQMHNAIIRNFHSSKANRAIRLDDLLWRGETSARVALMSSLGYPVSRDSLVRFCENVPNILKETAESVNKNFPGTFYWNKKENRYSVDTKKQKEWIAASEYADRWMKTDTDDYSISLPAYERCFSYSHEYPDDVFPAQVMKWLKTKKSLNGFMPKSKNAKNKETIFTRYGSDDRVRPWLNPYGAQSSRFQPSATGFIPLKSSWMRSLIQPKPGRAIVAIDYGSEEFLLAAILSGDSKMFEAYRSGDPYLYFGKLTGAIPQDGTKKTHAKERTKFKSTVLGISYLMGSAALARKLTADTGEDFTQEDAQELIDQFFDTFDKYDGWIKKTGQDYHTNGFLQLSDGWIMFGDNPNHRSVSNCPIQGEGAVIIRQAVTNCQDKGLAVMYPLHDALYVECSKDDLVETIAVMKQQMMEAFCSPFSGLRKVWATFIRMDVDAWGCGVSQIKLDGVKTMDIYVDERGAAEYEKFRRYL